MFKKGDIIENQITYTYYFILNTPNNIESYEMISLEFNSSIITILAWVLEDVGILITDIFREER